MNARGEAIIIGTVILIVIVLFSGGIVAYYTIKQAGSVETSCLEALNKVKFVDVGFSCRMSDAPNEMMLTSFSVKIVDDSIEGFNLGLESAGSALPYEIKQGARHEPLCLLDNVFGGALVVPRPGDTLTYVAKGNIQKLFISPILKGGKNCYSEARSEIEISNECINPAVENRLVACLGSVVGAVCGDGARGGNEECDDGNTINNDDCTNSCRNAICGDSLVWNLGGGNEECDDGNTGVDDGCSAACRLESCSVSNLRWSRTDVRDGENVNILANVATCGDETFSFTIKEDDANLGTGGSGDRDITPAPFPLFVNRGSTSISQVWTAQWEPDTEMGETNPPEAYFILAIQNGANFMSSTVWENELNITKCGDGIVQAENGEQCEVLGSTCNIGGEAVGTCSNNCICNAPPEPELGEALWNPASATEGDTVEIRVDGTNVANLPVEMEVWEDDGGIGDDFITTLTATFDSIGSPIRKNYIATWQCDGNLFGVCFGEKPEFYIKARLSNTAGSEIRSTNKLTVSEKKPTCGNNLLQAGETCDPPTTCTPFYGETCSYCDNSCNYKTSEGDICGDGILNPGYEVCDGNTFAGLGGETCVSQGYAGGGTLGCLTDCSGFDFAQCVNSGAVCGNGNREAGEVCDDGNTITETSCTIYGDPGTFCNTDCSKVITLSCPRCGDGKVQAGNGEQCDGSTQSCTTSGSGTSGLTGRATNENGVQTCSATCQWNTCTVTPAV